MTTCPHFKVYIIHLIIQVNWRDANESCAHLRSANRNFQFLHIGILSSILNTWAFHRGGMYMKKLSIKVSADMLDSWRLYLKHFLKLYFALVSKNPRCSSWEITIYKYNHHYPRYPLHCHLTMKANLILPQSISKIILLQCVVVFLNILLKNSWDLNNSTDY